jgi:hypothetical protein
MFLKFKYNYCTVLLYILGILFLSVAVVINFAVSIDVIVSPN